MSRFHVLSGVFLLSLSSFCVWAQSPESKPGTAVVTGRVTLKGAPARDVVVALQERSSMGDGQNPGLRATTGEDGAFKFTGVKAGHYMLGALAPGFVTPTDNDYGPQGKPLTISDGENIEDLNISLSIGAVITGRVSDGNDRPLVDEMVELYQLDAQGNLQQQRTNQQLYMYMTDDRGVYRLFGLPAGRYLVSTGVGAKEGGRIYSNSPKYHLRTYHPDAAERSQAKILALEEGGIAEKVDIKVAEAKTSYEVLGRVESIDGKPAKGIGITYGALTADGNGTGRWGPGEARTNAKGEFQLSGVLPGKYIAVADPSEGDEFYSDSARFEVSDENVSGLTIKLLPGGSISGKVVIEGVSDPTMAAKLSNLEIYANVISDNMSSPSPLTARIRADGGFRVSGLKPGVVQFYLGRKSELGVITIVRIEYNGAVQADGIQIGGGENVSGVRVIVAPATCSVRGEVRITGGNLPEDAILYVQAMKSGTTQRASGGSVDRRGRFMIEGLTPGEYDLKLGLFFRQAGPPSQTSLVEFINKQMQTTSVANGQDTRVTFNVAMPKPMEER